MLVRESLKRTLRTTKTIFREIFQWKEERKRKKEREREFVPGMLYNQNMCVMMTNKNVMVYHGVKKNN